MTAASASAGEQAQVVADRARITIRSLSTLAELTQVQILFEQIWHLTDKQSLVGPELLRAMVKAENYVAGAYDGTDLVGACIGFFGPPKAPVLHSHIAGVSDRMRGRQVGFALKLHQRAWALERGVHHVSWTFDPLIRRNAYFNLSKLAGTASAYLPNFYGHMSDGINTGDETDRLVVHWDLDALAVQQAAAGTPLLLQRNAFADAEVMLDCDGDYPRVHHPDSPTVFVGIPSNIEAMRSSNPAAATQWRQALRKCLGELMNDGGRMVGYATEGWYVVDRASAQRVAHPGTE